MRCCREPICSGSSAERDPGQDAQTPSRPSDRAIEHQVQPAIGGDRRPVGEPVGGHLDDPNILGKLSLDVPQMTGKLGELGVDRHRNSPGFDLELNRRLDLNPRRSRAGRQRGATLADEPAGPAERQRFLGKASPGFHERLVADRVGVRERIESARPVSRTANAQRSGIPLHSDRLEAGKPADGAARDIAGRRRLAAVSSRRAPRASSSRARSLSRLASGGSTCKVHSSLPAFSSQNVSTVASARADRRINPGWCANRIVDSSWG